MMARSSEPATVAERFDLILIWQLGIENQLQAMGV